MVLTGLENDFLFITTNQHLFPKTKCKLKVLFFNNLCIMEIQLLINFLNFKWHNNNIWHFSIFFLLLFASYVHYNLTINSNAINKPRFRILINALNAQKKKSIDYNPSKIAFSVHSLVSLLKGSLFYFC